MTADEKPTDPPSDAPPPLNSASVPAKKPAEKPDDDLSEEDQALKDKLDLLVTRVMDTDLGVQKLALQTIRTEIRTATSSMTSVPKPLKFLRPHFDTLKSYYNSSMPESPNRVFLADVLSVLSMTMGDSAQRDSLRYKLSGSPEQPHLWGHEYVRHLAGEIAQEYRHLTDPDAEMIDVDAVPSPQPDSELPPLTPASLSDLSLLVNDIVPFLITSNAEPEAVDLLIEVNSLPQLVEHADKHNYARVCLYLKSCADYLDGQDEIDQLLKIAAEIYIKVDKLPEAMQVALRKRDMGMIQSVYLASKVASAVRLQLALDLGRAGVILDDEVESHDDMRAAMCNRKLSSQFQALAKDLDVLEPKTPEDIYKSHLLDSRAPSSSSNVDSARANLAKTFVNAFVNMGFGTDKLMSDPDATWIYRNKEHGMMSTAASVGMIMMWDVDAGFNDIDKYLYAEQEYVRAGAMLAVGLVSVNVQHEADPPFALLEDYVTSDVPSIRHGSIAGLGLAYAGSQKETLKELLIPVLMDGDASADVVSMAALTLGLTFVGSMDVDLSMALVQVMADRKETGDTIKDPLMQILLPLAFGLLFLGRQEAADAIGETIGPMVGHNSMMGRVALITLQACAYCGSGSVWMIQNLLRICGEHPAQASDEEAASSSESNGNGSQVSAQAESPYGQSEIAAASGSGTDGNGNLNANASADGMTNGEANAANGQRGGGDSSDGVSGDSDGAPTSAAEKRRLLSAQQAVAVLGLAMIAMGEELGAEMSIRTFGHLLQYGDPVIRRVVPLAIGLLSISDPKLTLMDMLSKFTHDSDMYVAQSAIVGLGMIGAGTNNSRIAGTLRQLSVYYSKEPSCLFLVRIAQGLLHAGKGLVTLNPFYGDRFLENKTALGGLLTVLFCCLDMKSTILGKHHFLLYFLALAARPRMVYSVDEKLEFKATTVRVGQAVDTVGQAGKPKSITGFQTHTTPVLLAAGERAEMATEEHLAVGASLEGIVVVEKNPEWVEESGLAEAAARMEKAETELEKVASPSNSKPSGENSGAPSGS